MRLHIMSSDMSFHSLSVHQDTQENVTDIIIVLYLCYSYYVKRLKAIRDLYQHCKEQGTTVPACQRARDNCACISKHRGQMDLHRKERAMMGFMGADFLGRGAAQDQNLPKTQLPEGEFFKYSLWLSPSCLEELVSLWCLVIP